MVALAAERLRKTRAGVDLNVGVKAGSQIYRGGMVVLLAGFAIAARIAASRAELETMVVAGVAVDSALGGAGDGDVRIDIEKDVFCFANSAAGDAITAADIGRDCYAADDQTVAKTNGGGVRPVAGKIVDVDAQGVWVDFAEPCAPKRIFLPFAINQTDLLAGTSAEIVCPVAGAITSMSVIVQAAVTTGGDVTASVGGVAVNGLTCAVANGAAKGTIVTDQPTAGHATTVVAAGSRIQVIPAAAFDTAGAVSGFVEITL